ncbi:probable disease resistance protein At4g27220 isoform X2 [Henckelia pumila]
MLEVDKLLDQRNFSGSTLVTMLPERGKALPTGTLIGKTAHKVLKSTWEYLMDINIGIIGIYGMGGVGKTAIIKEVNNKLLIENTNFDDVIWVIASKDSDMQRLQKDIAKAIGVSLDDFDSAMSRATELFSALMRRGKFLLIIDDMWEAFHLDEIGIPVPSRDNACKILITTRSLRVCHDMETDAEIEVHTLSQREAWALFQQKVGQEVLSSPRIQDVAQEVAKECGGLPLALITIGRALRKESNIRHWKIALSELRNSTSSIEGMENQVFARLRFSYDRLKDDTTRSCLLYCVLYPEDHLIETEQLIKYWLLDGLLGHSGSQIARMQLGEMILNDLKRACMIESVFQFESCGEHVKMHDLIRDMVIKLTRENSSCMVRSGLGLQIPPTENEWPPDLEIVSLMRNDLKSINCEPKCPKLRALLLQYNSIIKGMATTFFEHMQNLKVLDLSYTGIVRLPDSLSNLERLRALLLRSCWNLQHVPTLAKLKDLRVLDLSYTSVEYMPEGMQMLMNLQHLDLSCTKVLNAPIHLLLLNYKRLENLLIIGLWEFTIGTLFIDVDVIQRCRSLVVLEVSFSSMEDFDRYINSGHWSLLDNFKFVIGYPPPSTHGKNSVGFFGTDIGERSSPALLPGRVLELEIQDCRGITQLPVFITAGASQLQCCKIRYCDQMEFIITPELSALPNLECLEIEGLNNLHRICRGTVQTGTLGSLKTLHVMACDSLKTLFPIELVANLKNLVEIKIENCANISEIIATREEDGGATETNHPDILLPMLQRIKLSCLPELKYICRGVMICDSLSRLEVLACPGLMTLPFLVDMREQLVCSLKQINGSRKWWEEIRRNHRDATYLLRRAFRRIPETSSDEESADGSIISFGSGSSSFGPR